MAAPLAIKLECTRAMELRFGFRLLRLYIPCACAAGLCLIRAVAHHTNARFDHFYRRGSVLHVNEGNANEIRLNFSLYIFRRLGFRFAQRAYYLNFMLPGASRSRPRPPWLESQFRLNGNAKSIEPRLRPGRRCFYFCCLFPLFDEIHNGRNGCAIEEMETI